MTSTSSHSGCQVDASEIGLDGLLEHLAATRLTGTLVVETNQGTGHVHLAEGSVLTAHLGDEAGMPALLRLARQAQACYLIAPEASSSDSLGLLTPVLIDRLRAARFGEPTPTPTPRVMDSVGTPIPLDDDDPSTLLDHARLVVRSRDDDEDASDSNFPDDFLSSLVPEHLRGGNQDNDGESGWVEPAIGYMLGKCYLSAELGRGATAIVYRAMHLSLKVDVAVKVFVPNQDGWSMNGREAHILARLNHPNVLRVLDCSEDRPYPHVVMEYVDGTTLRDLIAQTGRLQAAMALDFLRQAVEGLMHAHQHGVTHCDIKPGNFLISRHNELKVADLGIARMQVEDTSVTATNAAEAARAVVGTPAYIAPEVVQHGLLAADWRSDLYSLGATFYHAVAGRPPFLGEDPIQLMLQQVRELPPHPRQFAPELDPAVEALIMRLLDKDPARRADSYQSALDEIERLLEGPSGSRRISVASSSPIFITINQAWKSVRRALDRVLGS